MKNEKISLLLMIIDFYYHKYKKRVNQKML